MKLIDIKFNPSNPRSIDDINFEKLVKSIKDFPSMLELRPIIVDNDNVALGGNMRLKALLHLGYTDIPDSWIKRAETLTPEEIEHFIIVDNVGYGAWDYDMLRSDWDAEKLEEWGVTLPNLDIEDENIPQHKTAVLKLVISSDDESELSDLSEELMERGFKCEFK